MNPLLSPLRISTAVFCALLALTACAGILAVCRSGSPKKPEEYENSDSVEKISFADYLSGD